MAFGDVPPPEQRAAFFAADWDARLRALAREICRLPTKEDRWARIARFGEAQGAEDDKDVTRRARAMKNVERLKVLVREEWQAMKGDQE